MSVRIIKGNIFASDLQVMVNTVNCVGVMGAGIALECRLRYPELYSKYVKFCQEGKIDIGKLWLFRGSERWVLNFPTKKHWKFPTREEYLDKGLSKFVETYERLGITSIAFPLLGAQHGGLMPEKSLKVMRGYLDSLPIKIEIYEYDPCSPDDLYMEIRRKIAAMSVDQISSSIGIGRNYAEKLLEAFGREDLYQINQLGKLKGIGIKTLERVFNYATGLMPNIETQLEF